MDGSRATGSSSRPADRACPFVVLRCSNVIKVVRVADTATLDALTVGAGRPVKRLESGSEPPLARYLRDGLRFPASTHRGNVDGNGVSSALHRAPLRPRIPPLWKTRARDKSRKGHHILCRPRGESAVRGVVLPRRGAQCVRPRRGSCDRRKRARSFVYLAASRCSWPLTSPSLCADRAGRASTATLVAFRRVRE